ncbi:hypothetical protein Slin15195_G051250 [Septoria linicola]|uniref:Uncharacterized protein n=1 Tax=Septoria linicola TaxID=215465 RepID=A0A9Q9AW76_9PEZI|nr:hypothetical protein Slin14017_G129850 [Septoria linicola]USW51806.1 hypothetical protein Slin15195_G051250 [Septoria linicola]
MGNRHRKMTRFVKTILEIEAKSPSDDEPLKTSSTDISKHRRAAINGGHNYCGPYGPYNYNNMCYKCKNYPYKYYKDYE